MTERSTAPKKSRFLLRAVGVGTSVALFGAPACGGSTAGGTQADAGTVDSAKNDAQILGAVAMGSGDATVTTHGTMAVEAGPMGVAPADAMISSQGTMIADAGPVGDSVDAAGLAPIDAGADAAMMTGSLVGDGG